MPFEQCFPRQLNAGSVHAYAPAASGVYGISNAREWIYIGETGNIQGALLTHLVDRETAAMKLRPTGFVYEICDAERRPARRGQLVGEYGPACNREAPPPGHRMKPDSGSR